MGYKVIAPIGDNPKALFAGLKEFPTEKIIMITHPENLKEAKKLERKLEELTIESEIREINGNLLHEMFRHFGEVCNKYEHDEIVVNVATGDKTSTCAALSAAFANGLKSFDIANNKPVLLPIMKLSYYNELSDNKLRILKCLNADDFISLKELSEKLNMSISLLSYHVNGNFKNKGLQEYRLVEIKENRKNVFVKLSDMGSLLLKGYIKPKK